MTTPVKKVSCQNVLCWQDTCLFFRYLHICYNVLIQYILTRHLFVFDREVPSSLSMTFLILPLLLLRRFVKFSSWMRNLENLMLDKNSESLILDKKTKKSHLGYENQKVSFWIRKPKSLILDKKTGKSYLG